MFTNIKTAADLLSERQDAAWEKIKAYREDRGAAGIYEPVSMKWFHSDTKSRTEQLGLVREADLITAGGGNLDAVYQIDGPSGPVDLQWKTMDGTFIPMTGTLAKAIVSAYFKTATLAYAVAEQHKTAMLASATPETYDYSAGWPAVFGDA